jgi:hypothetical protein
MRRAALFAFALTAGCTRQSPPAQSAPRPALPDLSSAQLAPPVLVPGASSALGPSGVAGEPRVDIDTHGRDEEVRPLLEFVARAGGYRLIYPPDVSRRVRVALNDVPVSLALTALLDLAGLTLEPTTPSAERPLNRPVVFYELPVNVDSLSADAIVRRFGVSPAVADMIVKGRRQP